MRCEPGQGSTLTQHLTSLIFNEKSTTFRLTDIYPVPLIQYLCVLLNPTVPSGDYFTRRQAQMAERPPRRITWGGDQSQGLPWTLPFPTPGWMPCTRLTPNCHRRGFILP